MRLSGLLSRFGLKRKAGPGTVAADLEAVLRRSYERERGDPDFDPRVLELRGSAFLDAFSEFNAKQLARPDPAFDLSAALQALRATGRPAIALEPQPTWAPEARSWFGGLPTLPPSLGWPCSDGRPLSFLAQIDLSEAPEIEGAALPREGVLFVFARTDLSDYQGAERVKILYHPAPLAGLPESPAPPGLPRLDDGSEYHAFPWLDDREPMSRVDAKHTLRTRRVISYDPDFPPEDLGGAWNREQRSEFEDAAFEVEEEGRGGAAVASWKLPLGGATDPTWPATWRFVEHATRALEFLLDDRSRHVRGRWQADSQAFARTLIAEGRQWRVQASASPDQPLPAEAMATFRDWWTGVHDRETAQRKRDPAFGAGSLESIPMVSARIAFTQTMNSGVALPGEVVDRYAATVLSRERYRMLGYSESPQEAPAERGSDVLLLELPGGGVLSALWPSGCVLSVWIHPEALAAGRFEEATATFECD